MHHFRRWGCSVSNARAAPILERHLVAVARLPFYQEAKTMAKWFYYNERGNKIEVTGGRLKGLAKEGIITPDTVVETEEGKSAPARKVKGLTFPGTVLIEPKRETTLPEPPQSLSDDPPSAEPSPPESVNPFDAFNAAMNDAIASPTAVNYDPSDAVFNQESEGRLTSFHAALCKGDIAKIQTFISKGTDVNILTNGGMTPLHVVAALTGNVEVARILVSHGARINAKSDTGQTPLFVALAKGNTAFIKFLIANGANPNADGGMALNAAIHSGHVEIAMSLIYGGANVNAKVGGDITPLLKAAEVGNVEIGKLLVSKGSDVNAKSNDGYSPLFLAACNVVNVEFVKLLLSHGADVNIKNNNRITVLHIVARMGNVAIAQLLVSHGANVNAKADNGTTPLDHAQDNGKAAMAQYLSSMGAITGRGDGVNKGASQEEWTPEATQGCIVVFCIVVAIAIFSFFLLLSML
jgi:ankyrin repeat protein